MFLVLLLVMGTAGLWLKYVKKDSAVGCGICSLNSFVGHAFTRKTLRSGNLLWRIRFRWFRYCFPVFLCNVWEFRKVSLSSVTFFLYSAGKENSNDALRLGLDGAASVNTNLDASATHRVGGSGSSTTPQKDERSPFDLIKAILRLQGILPSLSS